jgi:glyoxylase-like metal-dependent hydrolase (beta-lactamase superfamily II)
LPSTCIRKAKEAVKVHYLNCGTMHPRFAPFFAPHLSRIPALCLLIETPRSLVLVDSGFGTRDMEDLSRLGLANLVINAQADPLRPAIRQLEGLGFKASDVSDIVCTHLDRDHAGGLPDFPRAKVHVMPAERDAASRPRSLMERERYRRCHFEHGPRWVTHEPNGARWFGLECIGDLPDLPREIVMVPLRGHTRGHCGVAVDTGSRWVLHCGDAYYIKRELTKRAPLDVRNFRRMAHINHPKAMSAIDQIGSVIDESKGAVTTIAAHDHSEYRRIFGRDLD